MTDRCYYVQVDGEWIRIQGERQHPTDASATAIADIVRAARRLLIDQPPPKEPECRSPQ